MSKVISEHPQKSKIDALICSGLSYRDLEQTLKQDFGINVSYKTISLYHKNELSGFVEPETEPEPIEPFELDFETIRTLTTELQNGQTGVGTVLHREFAELVAVQIQLTKNALIQHAKGLARYPSEYVRNLQTLTGIMYKNQQTNSPNDKE